MVLLCTTLQNRGYKLHNRESRDMINIHVECELAVESAFGSTER